jgi:Uma2 family endonuclease
VPELAPDIAVEVLSPSNTPGEMRQKMAEYFANGTRLVWLIDPRSRTIAVHTAADEPDAVLGEADKLTAADVLPAFEVAVATLFRELPEA